MMWNETTVVVKGEVLTLTKRGQALFRALSVAKEVFIVSGTIVLVWLCVAVLAVFE